jgi:ADP-ribosylglycohydrolase
MDRAIGTLLGLAAGDAVGTSLEFETREATTLGDGPCVKISNKVERMQL